jgi:glucose-1-phosphate thymidylyltransferase
MIRGIILAGGTGSRLGPLSKVTNKHLLPVGSVPMIYHPLSQLLCNNIKDICIVSGLFHLGSVVSLLGSGSCFGCDFTYKVQDEAGGIAEALNLCRDFAQNEDIMVFLGDNIFGEILIPDLNGADGNFYIKNVPDPHRFGIAEVDHLKKLIDIEEKPENPKSNMAVTGAYVYSNKIWEAINSIERSERGELEISDANKWLIKNGTITTSEVKKWWSDAGTQESYKTANAMVSSNLDLRLVEKLNKMILC